MPITYFHHSTRHHSLMNMQKRCPPMRTRMNALMLLKVIVF
jgi:hypothetical protein